MGDLAMNEEEIEAEHAATLKLEEHERFLDEQREPVLDEPNYEAIKQNFWFQVFQIALANLNVQSMGKAAEVSRRSLEDTIELNNKIEKVR